MAGQPFPTPDGFNIEMDPKNHHLHKPEFIGEIKADGQFNVVCKTKGLIKAEPWSPYIPGNKGKKYGPEKKLVIQRRGRPVAPQSGSFLGKLCDCAVCFGCSACLGCCARFRRLH